MKNKYSLLLIPIIICMLFTVLPFAIAETSLEAINTSLGELESQNKIHSTEAYQLIYDGERLIANGENDAEQVKLLYYYKNLYYKTQAKDKVLNACNDDFKRVIYNDNTYLFYDEQYRSVLEYRQAFIDGLEQTQNYSALVEEFFSKVLLLPDIQTLSLSRDKNIYTAIQSMLDSLSETVDESLVSRGFEPFNKRLVYNDPDFETLFSEVLNSAYFTNEVNDIKANFDKAVDDLNALPPSAENAAFNLISQVFIDGLAAYPMRTASLEEGILTITRNAALDRLNGYLQQDDMPTDYIAAVKRIVDETIPKIQAASTVDEVEALLSNAEEDISNIVVKNYSWLWLLGLAIFIFVAFAVCVTLYFKKRERQKGMDKYKRLLDDERERMQKEFDKAISLEEQKENKVEPEGTSESTEINDFSERSDEAISVDRQKDDTIDG